MWNKVVGWYDNCDGKDVNAVKNAADAVLNFVGRTWQRLPGGPWTLTWSTILSTRLPNLGELICKAYLIGTTNSFGAEAQYAYYCQQPLW